MIFDFSLKGDTPWLPLGSFQEEGIAARVPSLLNQGEDIPLPLFGGEFPIRAASDRAG